MRKVPKLRFKDSNSSNYPEWEEKRLENISELITKGTTPKKFIENGNIKFIKVEAINSDKINNKKCLFISEETHTTELQRSILKKNDLLFSIAGSLGKTALIEQENLPANANQALCIIRLNKNQNHKFILYSLNSKTMINYILLNTSVGAQPNLSLEQMKNFKFFIPSLQEQEKIAAFLSLVDKKISLIEEKLELFREYKKGVMQKIFSQELRFKDNNGNDYPEWEEKRLGELPIIISDGNYGELYPKANELLNEGVPFIRVNNLKNSKIVKNEMKYISKELHNVLLSGHLKFGDILISTRGDIGITAYVEKEYDNANINAQLCLIRVTGNYFNNKFLLYLFQNNSSQKQFNELQTGSALKQLPKKNLIKLKVNIPVLEEQEKIADFLSSIDSKIESIEKELEELKEFKKGLLQQMFV